MKNLTLLAGLIASGGAQAICESENRSAAGNHLADLSIHMAEHILRETGEDPDGELGTDTVSKMGASISHS